MQIIIELGDEVTPPAELLIRQAVEACARNEVDFQGDDLAVRRGDFTCVAEGEGHSDAARLFALVQHIAADPAPFSVDHDSCTLIPLSGGGFERQAP